MSSVHSQTDTDHVAAAKAHAERERVKLEGANSKFLEPARAATAAGIGSSQIANPNGVLYAPGVAAIISTDPESQAPTLAVTVMENGTVTYACNGIGLTGSSFAAIVAVDATRAANVANARRSK